MSLRSLRQLEVDTIRVGARPRGKFQMESNHVPNLAPSLVLKINLLRASPVAAFIQQMP